MLLRSVAVLGLSSLVAPSASAWEDWCQVRAPREATVDAGGAELLRVEARAGSLRIVGERGLDRVIVQGKACAPDQASLDAVRLRAEKSGREIRVIAEIPQHRDGWPFNHGGGGLDLEIRVPASLAADVTDSSGDAQVSGLASLRIEDSSGELRIRDIAGEVRVVDRSGELAVENVGALTVEQDGSGSIDVRDVKGAVVVREDGSGGIEIRDVGGDVKIGKTGSGGVRVDNVRGDFTVDRVGSGGIEHSRVGGRVDVPEDRHSRRNRERERERAERDRERAERDRERAERDRERAHEHAARHREQSRARAERERERAERILERAREQAQQARERAERYRYR